MAGLIAPDEGEVGFDGERLAWPFAAQDLGIEIITQRPELVEAMDSSAPQFADQLYTELTQRYRQLVSA